MSFRHLLVLTALAMGASPAVAHPKLLSGSPAAGATVAKTGTVRLVFSERVDPRGSTATLVMTGMPGMANHPDMKMTGVTTAVSPDGKMLVVTSARPLPAGSYRIDWAVVGADTHRVTGTHAFTIG